MLVIVVGFARLTGETMRHAASQIPHNDTRELSSMLEVMDGIKPPNALEEAIHARTEANLNANFGVTGWELRNVGWTTGYAWDALIDIAGFDNIKMVTLQSQFKGQELARQGSILVSPEGAARLREHYQETETKGSSEKEP